MVFKNNHIIWLAWRLLLTEQKIASNTVTNWLRGAGNTRVKAGSTPQLSPLFTRCDFPAPRNPHPAFYPYPVEALQILQ